MYCRKCGRKLSENTKYCVKCGIPVARRRDEEPAPYPVPPKKTPKKSKRWIPVVLLVALVLVAAIIAAIFFFSGDRFLNSDMFLSGDELLSRVMFWRDDKDNTEPDGTQSGAAVSEVDEKSAEEPPENETEADSMENDLEAGVGTEDTSSAEKQHYQGVYGSSFWIPGEFELIKENCMNTDEAEYVFSNDDLGINLRVHEYCVSDKNAASTFLADLYESRNLDKITYNVKREDFFVISGIDDNCVYYEKTMVDENVLSSFVFIYPNEDEKTRCDRIVETFCEEFTVEAVEQIGAQERVLAAYFEALPDAINAGDFSRVSSLLKPSSSIWQAQKKLVDDLSARGITEVPLEYEVVSCAVDSDTICYLDANESIDVYYADGTSKTVYQSYTYVMQKQRDGSWLLTDILE